MRGGGWWQQSDGCSSLKGPGTEACGNLGGADQDFSEELRSHLAMEADHLQEQGLTEEEAKFAARREMGNVALIEEQFYEMCHWRWLSQFWQDVRGCLRQWRKRPVTTAAAILTIALGTGLNVAIFRVIWNVLLKPLPYADAANWRKSGVSKRRTAGCTPADRRTPSGLIFQFWRSRSRSFEMLANYRPWRCTVDVGGAPERVAAGMVSAELLPVLGGHALMGRLFVTEDVQPGKDNVVVLSYGYWKGRFGGASDLVGGNLTSTANLAACLAFWPPISAI